MNLELAKEQTKWVAFAVPHLIIAGQLMLLFMIKYRNIGKMVKYEIVHNFYGAR